MNTPLPESDHESSRIRQFHAVCLLLENEQTGVKVKARHAQRNRSLNSVLPHGFLKGLTGLVCVVLAVSLLVTQLIRRSPAALVPDYRWSAHYDAADASDVEFVPDRHGLLLATRGNAIHELDVKSGYFKQHTSASTRGGLLSDDVAELQRGDGDRLFLLCERDGQRGLVSSSTALTDWKSLIGLERFTGLKDGSPTGQIAAVADVGNTLWLGTRESGIGVYDPMQHAWVKIYQAAENELLDNRVNDLLVAPDGHVWIATATGINRVSPQDSVWEQFRAPAHLVGAQILRLSWQDGRLLYVTAGGGMGQFDGRKWETISEETHWGNRSDQDVAVVAAGSDPRHLWCVGLDGAAGRYDSRLRGWTEFSVKSGGPAPLSASATVGRDGPQLWVGTKDGLQVLDVNAVTWTEGGLKGRPVVAVDAGTKAVAAMVGVASGGSPLAAHVSAAAGAWRMAIGHGRATTGMSGILSVAFDEARQQLLAGSEAGISLYDVRIHDWLAPQKPQTGKLPPGSVVDLQLKGDEVLVLTAEGQVSTWNRKSDNWTAHLGGGRFPGGMADVSSITRSSDGRLWFGSSQHGIHTYDPVTRRWSAISSRLTGVSQLAADQEGIWCLASGRVHYIDAKQTVREVRLAPSDTLRLFASPQAEGAIVIDPQGRVLHLPNTQSIQTVIGDPLKGLDIDSVTCVVRDRDLIVLGGKSPAAYHIATRSWTRLKVGEIVQAVTASNRVWLRDQQGKLYSLSSTNPAPVEVPTGGAVAGLAALGDELLALRTTGAILRSKAGVAEWEVAKTAPAGPKPDLVLAPAVSVTAQAEDLLLAGGAKQEVWRFSWLQQRWEQILVAANRQLAGVGRLASGEKKSYALVPTTGEVFSIASGAATAKLEAVPPVSRLQSSGRVLSATGRHGGVQINRQDEWSNCLTDAKGPLAGATLTDAVEFSDGVVLGSSKGAAWLSADLTTWKSIGGNIGIERFLKPHSGEYLWAISDRKLLFQIDRDLPDGRWHAITFPNPQATVSHVAFSQNKDTETGWVCLTDGTVHQVDDGMVTSWHQPTAAPDGPENIVGMFPATRGPVVAFRNGSLALFNETRRQWYPHPAPSLPGAAKSAKNMGIAEVAVLGADPNQQSWWVLGTNGNLLTAPRAPIPNWRLAATDVSDISVAGDVLYAVSAVQRSVLQFGADRKSQALLHAPGGFQKPKGPFSAAGEMPRDDGPPLLVLTDPERVQTYDPISHQWKSQDLVLSKLQPISGGLAGLTATGKVVSGEWKADQLKFAPLLANPTMSALQMATAPDDNRVVVQLTDGRVVVLQGQQPVRPLRGPWLPKEAMKSKIVDLAVLGTHLFLTLDNSQMFVYDASQRAWSSLKDFRGTASRLAVQKQVLWFETQMGGDRFLYRLEEEQPGKLAAQLATRNFDSWHLTPAGPLVEVKTPQGTEHRLVDNAGKIQTLTPPSLGPVDTDVVGYVPVGNEIWLATKGGLWHYHAVTHRWSVCDPEAETGVHAAMLDRPLPLLLTSTGSLRQGNWEDQARTRVQFKEMAKGVTSFDADDKSIASCGDLQVTLRQAGNADAEVKHEMKFGGAGWKSAKAQPVAAVGRGGELWVASDAQEISSYRLDERTWRTHAPALKPVQELLFVDDKLHAVSAKGEVAVLNGDAWQSLPAVARTAQPESVWTVNASAKPLGLSVELVAGTSVSVSLSAPGRFGFDRPRGVALFANHLYVSTDDALLAYSLTEPDLKVPVASHDMRRGELLVSADRKRLLVQHEREGRRVTQAFDCTNWTNASEQAFADESSIRKLRNRQAGQPLDFKLNLGAEGKTSFVAGYRGRGLLHDIPVGPQCVTTDGSRIYLLTGHGIVIRDDKGQVEALQSADANALAWRDLEGDAAVLVLRSRDGLVSKLTAGRIEKTTIKWVDSASSKTVKWHETEYGIEISPTRTVAEFRGAKSERLVLNIAERGFLHDHVIDMIRAGESVWTLSPGRCERTSLAQGDPYTWQFQDTGTAPSLQTTELGPCIVFGDVFYLLTERDVPSKVQPSSKGLTGPSVVLSGAAWRVTRTSQDLEIQFRNAAGQWTDARFDKQRGLMCDIPIGVTANGEYLVLATQGGSFVTSLATARDGISLMELSPVPGLVTSTQARTVEGIDLWTDPGGTIWGRSRELSEWQPFDSEQRQWSRGRDLPAPALGARNRLYTGTSATWRRNGPNVEFVETTPEGQEAISILRANGQFDFSHIDAAFETPEGVWTATRSGLRLIEKGTGRLVALSIPAGAPTGKPEFRPLDDTWYLQYGGTGPRFRLEGTAWVPLKTEPSPFDSNRTLADSTALRVDRAEGSMRFRIKPGLGSDELQSCTFVSEEGRFDFQLARDAVANDELIHVSTAVGVSTWRFGKDGREFVSLRSDLTAVEVSGLDGKLACINRAGKTEEYRDATWHPVAIDADKRSILAATSRWICRSTPEKVRIFVNQAQDQSIELDLDSRGDFAYRYPVWMQTQDDGACWTATQHVIIRNRSNAFGAWIPQQSWKPSEVRRDAQEVRSFTVLEGIPYVDLDGSLYQYDSQTGWKELADVEDFRRKRNQLWSDKQWTWQRTDQGITVEHKASSGEVATLEWDQAEGRFDWDQATDAAVSSESIWLATKPGVTHILKSNGATTLQYKFPVSAQDAFFVDMSNGALCIAAAGKVSENSRYAVYDAASGADVTQEIPAGTADLVFNSIYNDGIWTFQKSATPPILWHGHRTDLANGRFQHDDFQSLTWIGENIWLPTPVTLVQYRKEAQGIAFAKSFPLPQGQTRIEVLSASKDELHCLVDDRSRVSLNATESQWKAVMNAPEVSSRTLVDTPFWTWTRDSKRDISVTVKPSTDTVLQPVLMSDGRFLFDNMSTCLSDDSTIWFAGEGGIINQNSADGQFKRWYRSGLSKAGSQPLGSIIRLGRFGKEGNSISSGATKAVRDAASLYARSDRGRVWKYNPKGTGAWNEVDTDPWRGKAGDALIRSSVVDVLPGEKGRVKLAYAGSQTFTGPVMNKGRLKADVIHAFGQHDKRAWLATDAGLVECDSADIAFRNVSSQSVDQSPGALASCRRIFVHPKDKRLYAATHDDRVYMYEPASGWRRAPQVKIDSAFKEQAGTAFDNEFWIWSRWGDDVNVRLKRASPALAQWPLFVDGRFSFDVVRSIAIQKDHIVAATAAGLVQFRTSDMQIEQLDRAAVDADTGQLVSLGDVEEMLRTSRAIGLNQNFRFECKENQWTRTLRTHLPEDWFFVDGANHWQVAPRQDASQAGSLHLELSDSGGRIKGRYDVLPGVPESQLRRMIAADGKLWIILNRGIYEVTPR